MMCSLVPVILSLSGCGMLSAPPTSPPSSPEPSPTLLPPPKPFTSPEPGAVVGPASSPVSAGPTAPPTRVPPPDLNPTAPAGDGAGERARVVNTEGQGANMRVEPSPGGTLVRTVREGTEL